MPGPAPKRNPKTQTELLQEMTDLLEEIRDEFREDRLSPAAIVAYWKSIPPAGRKMIIYLGIPATDIIIGSIHPEWSGIIRTILIGMLGTGSPFPTPPMGP